ncbi:MAG: peptidylprolyl isomerase [Cellulosilyticaceae bacterium]
MKKFKKVLAVALSATLFMTGLTGCSGNQGVAKDQPIVAVIDGVEVPQSLYRTYLWSAQQILEQISGPLIWDMELEGKSTEEWAKENALESATLSVVAEKKAEEMKIEMTKEDKKAAKEDAEQFGKVNGAVLESHGFTVADVEQVLLAAKLSAKVQEKLMSNYVPVEEDVQKFVEENQDLYATVTAKHVLIETVDEMGQPLPEAELKEKEALANEVLQKALAGEDMATLAKEYSEDPGSKDKGGEYTFPRGQMVKEFEEAAFNGKDGEVYPELVKTNYGYHIIKTEAHHAADEAKMREDFIKNEKMKFMNTEIGNMIKNATVEKTEVYDTVKIVRAEVEAPKTDATTESAPEESDKTTGNN